MKNTKAILLSLIATLGATPALASNSHFMELQFSASELAQIVRARLMTSGLFCPVQIPCPSGSGQCIVDHIDYPAAGTMSAGAPGAVAVNDFTTLTAPRVQLDVPIVAHVKTLTCVYEPSCTATQPFSTSLRLIAHVTPEDRLCFSPAGLGVPVPVPMPTEQFCVDLDVSSLQGIVGDGATVTGRGVSLDTTGARLGARFEVGVVDAAYDATRIAAWQAFLDGTLAPGVASSDWSSFVHHTLIEQSVSQRLIDGAAAAPDLALAGLPSTAWTALGSAGGRVDLSVGAEYDSCVDISPLEVQANLRKNLASTGLDLFGTVDWDADAWDTAWCGFQQAGPFGAIAGPIIASTVDLSDVGGIGGGCVVSDNSFGCSQTTHPQLLHLGGGWLLDVELSDVIGVASGLVMTGPTGLSGPALPDLEITMQTPSWGYRGNCRGGRCGYEGALFIEGNARLCGPVQWVDDSLGAYEIDPPPNLTPPLAYGVRMGTMSSADRLAFEANPYGPTAVVWSSVGVRAYRFDAPTIVAHNEAVGCDVLALAYEAQRCLRPKWKPWRDRFNPEWVIDPWDRIVIAVDRYSGLELGLGFVDELAVRALWNRTRTSITGVEITGTAYFGFGPSGPAAQEVVVRGYLRSGTRVTRLATALEYAFPRGLDRDVAVAADLLPATIEAATFGLEVDLGTLLDLVPNTRTRGG